MDATTYREVMGHFPTGVVVVAGLVADAPVGMVVGSFGSVSIDPPLVSFMPMKSSATYARLAGAESLCVSVLAHDQVDACRTLAGSAPDKFDRVAWHVSAHGAPALDDAVVHVHARLEQQVDAGDHWIVLCSVDAMEVVRPVTPLLFLRGGYGGFAMRDMTARGDAEVIMALRMADPARLHIEALAQRLQCEASVLVAVNEDELTTAVSAWGGSASAELGDRLGQRLPLVPPIGEAFVSAARPEVVERWLAKASDTEELPAYRARLARVAREGVAVSVIGPGHRADFERLHQKLADYAAGPHTPSRERALRSGLPSWRVLFPEAPLEDDGRYDVAAIAAPVRGPDGDVTLMVRLSQLPPAVPGTVVQGWVAALKDTVAGIERELRDGAVRPDEDYASSVQPGTSALPPVTDQRPV